MSFDRDLNHSARAWLVAEILKQPGIALAQFRLDNLRKLQVDFDPDRFSRVTLVDWVDRHSARARVVAINAAATQVGTGPGDRLVDQQAVKTASPMMETRAAQQSARHD